MHNRHYLIAPTFLVLIYLAVQFYIFTHSPGGIDIGVYWTESPTIRHQTSRYYREILSWEIIRTASIYLDRQAILAGIGVSIFLISVGLAGTRIGVLLFSSLLTPFGIMLELNVLRQCYATIIVCIACAYFVRGRVGKSYVLFGLAFLCHNSVLVIISAIVGLHTWRTLSSLGKFTMFALSVTVGVGLSATGILAILLDGQASSSFRVVDDGPENAIYLLFCCLYGGALFVSTREDWRMRIVAVAAPAAALAVFAISNVLGMESLVYGRIAIGGIVVCNFLLLYKFLAYTPRKLFGTVAACLLLIIGVVMIPFHPGVMSMIGGHTFQ